MATFEGVDIQAVRSVERMRQSKYTVDGVKEAVFSGERRPKRLG